jgi:predicted Zn-ribbon and HTH transcriptional regulator
MVEYSSESSDDEEADMCVAEWSWGSKSKPFVCSSLKSASKSRRDEMRYMFDVAKCDRIFDYLLQEKQIKLPSGCVIPSSEQLKTHA